MERNRKYVEYSFADLYFWSIMLNDKINKIEVIIIDQENKFILIKFVLKFFK